MQENGVLKPPSLKGRNRKVVKLIRRDVGNVVNEKLLIDTASTHQKEQENRQKHFQRAHDDS